MILRASVVTLAVLAAACGSKGGDHECVTYARRDFECGGYPASEKALTLKLAEGFCREIQSGNKELELMSASIKAGLACSKTTTTCDAYQACVAKAEQPASPP
ncbi:MAG TPA: hypothetical protein VM734_18460 [Kofleriaceae bacterium]|nr:hypothetical protein [Kofleriaceae bacterium]